MNLGVFVLSTVSEQNGPLDSVNGRSLFLCVTLAADVSMLMDEGKTNDYGSWRLEEDLEVVSQHVYSTLNILPLMLSILEALSGSWKTRSIHKRATL